MSPHYGHYLVKLKRHKNSASLVTSRVVWRRTASNAIWRVADDRRCCCTPTPTGGAIIGEPRFRPVFPRTARTDVGSRRHTSDVTSGSDAVLAGVIFLVHGVEKRFDSSAVPEVGVQR